MCLHLHVSPSSRAETTPSTIHCVSSPYLPAGAVCTACFTVTGDPWGGRWVPVGEWGQARQHVGCGTPQRCPTCGRAGRVPCCSGNAVLEVMGCEKSRAHRGQWPSPGNSQHLSQTRGSKELMLVIYQPTKCWFTNWPNADLLTDHVCGSGNGASPTAPPGPMPTAASTAGVKASSWKTELSLRLEIKTRRLEKKKEHMLMWD